MIRMYEGDRNDCPFSRRQGRGEERDETIRLLSHLNSFLMGHGGDDQIVMTR